MRINEILVESQQLDEGPLGSAVKAVGRGIGKTIGGVAKAAGAVAGVAQGAKTAFQKGKQAAVDVIGGTGQGADAPEPAAAAPATTAQAINKAGPKGTAPAQTLAGAAGQAIQKTAQAVAGKPQDAASQTIYSQVKAQIGQLDKKGKQRILQLLQKSLQQPAAAAPAAPPAGAAAKPAARGTPIKVGGKAAAPGAPSVGAGPGVQAASKINTGNPLSESVSLYRKR